MHVGSAERRFAMLNAQMRMLPRAAPSGKRAREHEETDANA
jgi:hypothetical protein